MNKQGEHGEEPKDLNWKDVETRPQESKEISQDISHNKLGPQTSGNQGI